MLISNKNSSCVHIACYDLMYLLIFQGCCMYAVQEHQGSSPSVYFPTSASSHLQFPSNKVTRRQEGKKDVYHRMWKGFSKVENTTALAGTETLEN